MTTEATFQAALDADPTDWQTRLVFADWLLDRGDMRWAGMLWLGVARKWPQRVGNRFDWNAPLTVSAYESNILPVKAIEKIGSVMCKHIPDSLRWYSSFDTRADAEDAFCRAYPALAAAHPAEFAVGVMA